jgi:hypothetical protein
VSRGIELRATLDGRPIVQANSYLLHLLAARTLGVDGGWLAMFGGPAHLDGGAELLIEYRAAEVPDGYPDDDDEPETPLVELAPGAWGTDRTTREILVWEGDQA